MRTFILLSTLVFVAVSGGKNRPSGSGTNTDSSTSAPATTAAPETEAVNIKKMLIMYFFLICSFEYCLEKNIFYIFVLESNMYPKISLSSMNSRSFLLIWRSVCTCWIPLKAKQNE